MNFVKGFYCRIFQAVLKLVIPVLPYRSPLVFHSVADVPALLAERNITRIMIVTDGFLHLSGKLEPMKKALRDAGIIITVYDEVVPDPTIWNVEIARERYIEINCQALIGFGGGSAIDCAKAVGSRIARPDLTIPRMRGILKIWRPLPYLIAVPTTAGTGSEVTLATVITDDRNSHKFPISDFPLIPRAAVLDPEMTRSMPRHLTAATGMDALTHAIEAYIGNSTTWDTRADALTACQLIAENLEAAWEDGDNMEARANMLDAAYYAGRAFTKSYVGYCHAVAHSLGGQYHIPHGLANAVLLPYVLSAYGHAIDDRALDICEAMGIETTKDNAAILLVDRICRMNARMGIPTTLAGIREEDIPRLARLASKEANPLYPVPRLMSARELEQFYYDVMEVSA